MPSPKTCSVGDGRPVKSRGLCKAHYSRWWQTGQVSPEIPLRAHGGNSGVGPRPPRGRATDRRTELRLVLAGDELWPGVPHPEPGTEEYRTMPSCGSFGCECPPLAEIDRIVDRLLP